MFSANFQLKYVTSYCTDNVNFMDGHTNGRTGAGDNNTPSVWKPWGKNGMWLIPPEELQQITTCLGFPGKWSQMMVYATAIAFNKIYIITEYF